MNNIILFILFNCFIKFINGTQQSVDNAEELYKNLFKHRRYEQLQAVKGLIKLSSYERKYSMVMLMAGKIFTTIQENRAQIESSNYIPGVSEFPKEDMIKSALSNILENTALFSEVILRLPEISQEVLKSNNNWDILLQWSIAFSSQVKYLFDNNTNILLHLVSQELNHIEREPNYRNPYRINVKSNDKYFEHNNIVKKKEKKKIKKGPRFTNEL